MSDEPGPGDERRRSVRKYVDDYTTNWRGYRGSFARKLALATRNRTKAFTIGMGCCGHPGEPGC
jgi:hypothetical protein